MKKIVLQASIFSIILSVILAVPLYARSFEIAYGETGEKLFANNDINNTELPPNELIFESGSTDYHSEAFGSIQYNSWPKDNCVQMSHSDYNFSMAWNASENSYDSVQYYSCSNNYVCWTYIDMDTSRNYAHCEVRTDGVTPDNPDDLLANGPGRQMVSDTATCESDLGIWSMACSLADWVAQVVDSLVDQVIASMQWRIL